MEITRKTALIAAGMTLLLAIVLIFERGGLIAWLGLVIASLLLVKILRRPSRYDLAYVAALVATSGAAWAGTLAYVIATYESGEVVELAIDTPGGVHIARVWVMELGEDPVIYYEADPEIAESLLAGRPLQFTRSGRVSSRVPEAAVVDSLPEEEAARIQTAMETKYGDRLTAATVYYLLVGSPRDRLALVVSLAEE